MRVGHALWAALCLALMLGAARADEQSVVMKITIPTIHDTLNKFADDFAAALAKDAGGRIKGEVYPASQLGSIARQIEGVQFGSIQVAVIPPEFYVGIDERFEVMAAPGLVRGMAHAERVAWDPEVQKLMLGLGANKGLHGVALLIASPSEIISKAPIRHLADFKGKKIRIFTSEFQSVPMERLGATPVAMTLGDVLPAIQQGTIDGAVAALPVYTTFHYVDAAKYVTDTGQPFIFAIVEVSDKWFRSLPKDLQDLVARDATQVAHANNSFAIDFEKHSREEWAKQGGELIELPPGEQAAMMESFAGIGEEVSKPKPALAAAYKIVSDAAKRDK